MTDEEFFSQQRRVALAKQMLRDVMLKLSNMNVRVLSSKKPGIPLTVDDLVVELPQTTARRSPVV